ncbi:lysophospholipid acyltransferase family protein [Oceanicaulis sp. LC35]|uniref:lysophospholipid acyltransferase family protein n=1 Tax=Oceanicaulis sp. LC35 TaxID=3349635 RepID=UPI003F841946
MLKSIVSSAPVQALIAALLAGYMSLVKATTRWDVRGLEHAQPVWDSGDGVIGCVWHGRILMTIAAWPKRVQPPAILISRSREGDVVTKVARHHKVGVVRGSSRNKNKTKEKGGLSAFREMVRWVEGGGCMALTPDGPRGPRMRAGLGAIKLGRATGAPLLGLGWSTSNAILFKSWDRFMLPLPFGKGVIVWTEPVLIPKDADKAALETARATLEARMITANMEADLACRGEAITAAPKPDDQKDAA